MISIRQRNKLFRYSPSQKYGVRIDLVMHHILKWREVSCEKSNCRQQCNAEDTMFQNFQSH